MSSSFNPTQQQGGFQSIKSKIETGAVIAKFISDPLLPLIREDIGYSAVTPMTLLGVPIALLVISGGHITPLTIVTASAAVLGMKQRGRSWKKLCQGILKNPYGRGTSRLKPLLMKIKDDKGVPYFNEAFIERWGDPLVVVIIGYMLMKLHIAGGLGPYLLLSGFALRAVEHLLFLKGKEQYLNGVATLARAQEQSAIAQQFTNPAPERASVAPAGLSTGIGSDLAGKVEELKADEERKKHPPGGGIIAGMVVLLALLLSGNSRAASPPGPCSCYCSVKGGQAERAVLLSPLPDGAFVVSSSFGMRRHPLLKRVMMHYAVDLAAAIGTPIYAAADGVVAAAGRFGWAGNFVLISHGDGILTGYAHAESIAVRRGMRVRQGQVIGWVGSTGCSTGPHLHYELWVNGARVNPALVCHLLHSSCGCMYLTRALKQRGRLQMVKHA